MKIILVPTDFSPASRNAGEYAAQLAKYADASLYLLHVYKDIIPATVGPEPWSVQLSGLQQKNEAELKQEIQSLEKKYSVKVNGEVVRGVKGDSIEKVSKEIAADLIVMGIKAGKLERIPGRTSLIMTRRSEKPVLMVPEGFGFHPLKNIVLAVSFNDLRDSASLTPLFTIIKIFDASLRVLHIEKKGADVDESEMDGKLQMGQSLSKVSYLYDKVEHNDIDQGILEFVRDHPADMLVMITHRESFFEQVSGEEHTRSVSLEVSLPLLVLKNRD